VISLPIPTIYRSSQRKIGVVFMPMEVRYWSTGRGSRESMVFIDLQDLG
jgi:hypothetical protein